LTPRSGSLSSAIERRADCRLFGVTTLDVVRSSRFLGEIKNKDPKDIEVTVVGGHSGVTIVPLLSQTSIGKDVKGEEYKALVKRIQFGGDEVVQAKAGTGSATLSMGFGQSSHLFCDMLTDKQ
jgi:malate dehydrogenase